MTTEELTLQSREELHPTIRVAALDAAAALVFAGHFYTVLEPGDMTRYELFGILEPGGHTMIFGRTNLGFGGGAYHFRLVDGFTFWDYMDEKLGLHNEHSARVLSDFLNLLREAFNGA